MYYRILLVVIAIQLFVSYPINAQDMSGSLSLHDAMEATLKVHPQLQRFPLRREALQGGRDIAGLRPPLSINAGIEDAIGTGNLSGINGAELSLSLSRVIELGDKRAARVGVADRRLDYLAVEQEIAELDLLADVAYSFIDVVAAQERVELQGQARELAEETLSFLDPLVEAGRAPEFELGRARASLSNAETAERFAESNLESARVELSTLWQSQSPAFDRVESDFFAVGEAGSINNLLISILDNPSIEQYASEGRLLEARLREAQAQQASNVQWNAGIRHLKELDDTALMFNFSMPLGARERASGAIRTANANLAEVEYRRDAALNAMRGQLISLHIQLQQALYEVGILRNEVLPQLTDVLTQTRTFYEAGNYSYVELISAQREYLDAQLSLITSTANAHRLRTEIERLSGLPLTGEE